MTNTADIDEFFDFMLTLLVDDAEKEIVQRLQSGAECDKIIEQLIDYKENIGAENND